MLGLLVSAPLVALALAAALLTQPWRLLPTAGPPWPWMALWALLPLLWSPTGSSGVDGPPLLPAISGAALLVMMAGWPLAILAQTLAALLLIALDGQTMVEGMQRLLWLGVVPSTLGLVSGVAVRAWWPRQPAAYLLGRAFVGTLVSSTLAATLALSSQGGSALLPWSIQAIARLLIGFGEASITVLCVAALLIVRPGWLATWSERLYSVAGEGRWP